jgi:hypothetical protein
MTKQELLALAAAGHARIDVAYTITRYCVAPKCLGADGDLSEGAIFITISDEDGGPYGDDAYFVDERQDEVPLTQEEVDVLADIVFDSATKG